MEKNTAKSKGIVIFVVVSVLIGWIVGFAVGSTVSDNKSVTTGDEKMEDTTEENYSDQEMSVELKVTKDSMAGYNLQIITTGFKFTPENAGAEDVVGEGHAHVYVDGEKIGRAYGEWYHIPDPGEGEHEIKVSLNSNMHKAFEVDGKEVSATVTVSGEEVEADHVHEEGADDHSH